MAQKILSTPATATGDTTKTKMGDITVPSDMNKIIGVMGHCVGGAGVTTLENMTGLIEVESNTDNIKCQIPINNGAIGATLTSAGDGVKIVPTDMPVTPGSTLSCYITMDMAITIANTGRVAIIFSN